jgi:2-polyprenyl-6-methoxyphenol hydroxylase-like FAD-dependent oxidoreductase
MSANLKAIVIGSGIGGLAAAIGLQRVGIDVEVYERADELREVGAGISLWANAIKALDKLGVGAAIRSISSPEIQGGIRSADGKLLMGTSSAELRERFGELNIVMHRAALLAALLDAYGAERVRLGAHCVGFEQDVESVTARFADGRHARGDLLIGADGINSVVRGQLHGQQPPTYAGYTGWRAVLEFDHTKLRPGESWGRGSRFGQIPLSNGRLYWFATKNAPAGQHSPDGEKAELRRIFRDWHAPIPAIIEATNESAILRNDILDRPVLSQWGVGRVTLLGDAAHPMTPNLGQGACQAIEDAVVLANNLRESQDTASALRAYEAQRIPRATRIVNHSRRIGRIGQWENPLAVSLRAMIVKLTPPFIQTKQLERIIGYEV